MRSVRRQTVPGCCGRNSGGQRRTEIKMAVFWDEAPHRLVIIDRRFRGAYCFHHQGDVIFKCPYLARCLTKILHYFHLSLVRFKDYYYYYYYYYY
jgi:hypothetical protein